MGTVDSERLSKAIEDIKRQCDYAESAKEPEDEVSWNYETGILISRKDAENILLALANGIDEKVRREASALMRLVSVPQRAFILVETEHDRSGSYDRIVGYSFDKEYIVDEKRSRKMWAKDNGNHHIEYRIEEAQFLQAH